MISDARIGRSTLGLVQNLDRYTYLPEMRLAAENYKIPYGQKIHLRRFPAQPRIVSGGEFWPSQRDLSRTPARQCGLCGVICGCVRPASHKRAGRARKARRDRVNRNPEGRK